MTETLDRVAVALCEAEIGGKLPGGIDDMTPEARESYGRCARAAAETILAKARELPRSLCGARVVQEGADRHLRYLGPDLDGPHYIMLDDLVALLEGK